MERCRTGVIFYSLGNLVFDQSEPAGTKKGLLAEVTFQGAALKDAKVMPIEIVGGGSPAIKTYCLMAYCLMIWPSRFRTSPQPPFRPLRGLLVLLLGAAPLPGVPWNGNFAAAFSSISMPQPGFVLGQT